MAKRKSEEENAETMGWMITFSDLITLLLTFFVLLLTMCSLEAGKIKQFQSVTVEAMGVLLEGKLSEVEDRIIVSSKKRIKSNILITENILESFSGARNVFLLENEKGRIKFKEIERGFSIVIRDDLLFPSGESEINPEGISVLRKIGNAFKDFEGEVVVEGHTDNVPIHTEMFSSNWELSIARSVSVVKYLAEEVGVRSGKLSAVGYSDTKPVVPNDTPENRCQNRRVEIILVPRIT